MEYCVNQKATVRKAHHLTIWAGDFIIRISEDENGLLLLSAEDEQTGKVKRISPYGASVHMLGPRCPPDCDVQAHAPNKSVALTDRALLMLSASGLCAACGEPNGETEGKRFCDGCDEDRNPIREDRNGRGFVVIKTASAF